MSLVKSQIKRLMPWLPSFIKKFLRERNLQSKLDEHRVRKSRTTISIEEVRNVLCTLGERFTSRDVLLHASPSNIGKFEGGIGPLFSLLLDWIDLSESTLLAPAIPFSGKGSFEYLTELREFDIRTAPNRMGTLSQKIQEQSGARRSLHPTHSTVALGHGAVDYVEGHEMDRTPFAIHSPFYKITRNRGAILMLGVDLNSVTNFHVYEDLLGADFPFAVYMQQGFTIRCLNGEGTPLTISTLCHDERMTARRDCERMRDSLLRNNVLLSVPLGDSAVSVLDAQGLTVTLLNELLQGRSIYGPVKLTERQRASVDNALSGLQC